MLSSMQNIPKEKQTELLRLAGQLFQSGNQIVLDQLPDNLPFKKDNDNEKPAS